MSAELRSREKIPVILNPSARSAKAGDRVQAIQALSPRVEIHATTGPGDARKPLGSGPSPRHRPWSPWSDRTPGCRLGYSILSTVYVGRAASACNGEIITDGVVFSPKRGEIPFEGCKRP